MYLKIRDLAQERGLSMYTLSKETGISQSVFSRLKSDSTQKLSEKNLHILAKYFDVNINWLRSGEGEMRKNEPELMVQAKLYGAPVPYLEGVIAECGLPPEFTYSVFKEECENVVIPEVKADFILKAHGDSMINKMQPDKSITNGSLVACTKVHSGVIQWGSVYALATVDGIIIKQIKKHPDPQMIMCYSYNSDYEPFEFPKEFILDTAKVVKVLNYCDF